MATKMHLLKKSETKDYFSSWAYAGVKFDYREKSSCDWYGCTDEGMCRCRVIEEAKVTSVDVNRIADQLKDKTDSVVDVYCIDRILVINKIWEVDCWEIVVCRGYYGEEIDGVYLDQTIAAECEKQIEFIRKSKTDKDKIECILNLEYGYVLEEAKNRKWSVVNVPFEKLDFRQDHYAKLDKDIVLRYKDHFLPRGICLKKGDRYRVIDGYHRCCAAEGGNIDVIVG